MILHKDPLWTELLPRTSKAPLPQLLPTANLPMPTIQQTEDSLSPPFTITSGRGSRQQGSRSATPQTNPNSNSNTGRRRAGNGNRNRGHGGTNPRGGASHQDGRVQPNPRTGEPPKTNSQGEGLSNKGPSTQIQTDSQRVNGTLVSQNNTLDPGVNTDTQKVRVSGVRRIWGTVKSCSSGAVKNTVESSFS